MAINFNVEIEKIQRVVQKINTVGLTLKTTEHISSVLKNTHKIVSSGFIKHMTEESIKNPKKFHHMYEWNRIGDPNYKLWKHVLTGGGKNRRSYFKFLNSKTTVPVPEELSDIGVKKIHIFYHKAPILEYGLPVTISRKRAKALVYLLKSGKSKTKSNGGSSNTKIVGNIVFRKNPVIIEKQGNSLTWNAFTNEYFQWFSGNQPKKLIEQYISKPAEKTISRVVSTELSVINKRKFRNKSIGIEVNNYDPTIGRRLQDALNNTYAQSARNRVMENE